MSHCRNAATAGDFTAFIQHLLEDPFLLHYLRVALTHETDMLKDPAPHKYHNVTVNARLLPARTDDLTRLALGFYRVADNAYKINGRVNVTISDGEPAVKFDPSNKSMRLKKDEDRLIMLWKQATDAGRPDSPVVVVTFAYEVYVEFIVEITSGTFDTARGNPPPVASLARLLAVCEKPTSVTKTIAWVEFIFMVPRS